MLLFDFIGHIYNKYIYYSQRILNVGSKSIICVTKTLATQTGLLFIFYHAESRGSYISHGIMDLAKSTEIEDVGNAKLSEVSLLVIVVDTNPSQQVLRKNPQNISVLVDTIVALSNSHLLQKSKNALAILSCHHHSTDFLFPKSGRPLDVRQNDGQYEVFALVEKTVKQRLSQIINNAPKINDASESLLAGGISMALCYIARIQRNTKVKYSKRILVVTGSHECASQYISFQNVFFTAQKMNIVLDVCALDTSLSLLQQGCDITGGQYLRLQTMNGLLQYLLWVFLPDPEMREKLVLPPPARVDYRAACFCHRELIDIGFVCSVCLSIFCKYSPICTTCNAMFKIPQSLPPRPKKRR